MIEDPGSSIICTGFYPSERRCPPGPTLDKPPTNIAVDILEGFTAFSLRKQFTLID